MMSSGIFPKALEQAIVGALRPCLDKERQQGRHAQVLDGEAGAARVLPEGLGEEAFCRSPTDR